jgi:hypothetical protein
MNNLRIFFMLLVFSIVFLVYSINKPFNKDAIINISYFLIKQGLINDQHTKYDSILNTTQINNCSKWIVLTTINEPSDSVKYLRDSTFDWCFISIGPFKHWKYKDIQFIDTYQQYKLKDKFKIINKIPFNSYFRKIIGYLKAIEQKAKYIYEINDYYSAEDGLLSFKYERFKGIESTCDDYESLMIDSLFKKCRIYSVTNRYPIIQYSMKSVEDLNQPPLSLKEKQYLAYGSENTFYHYDSFWSLVFPSMFKTNESILIRGFLTKRLLDEINSTISFMAPNFNSNNNNNNNISNKYCIKNYSNDFKMYINKLILNLNKWKCSKNLFYKCFIDVIYYLVKKDIFSSKEIDFYNLWIDELNSLNYKWPELKKINLNNSNPDKRLIYFNQNLKNNQHKLIETFCNTSFNLNLIEKNEKVILITQANKITDLNYISIIQTHFSYIIVCFNNSNISIDISIYSFTFILTNESFSKCIEIAFEIGFKKESFLVVEQFLKFKYWNFKYTIIEKSKSLNLIDQNIYFIRRNVALGNKSFSKIIIFYLKLKKNFLRLCKIKNSTKWFYMQFL